MDSKQWFRDAKFGMMIHFGLYSLLGGEWKGERMDDIGEWIQAHFEFPMQSMKSWQRFSIQFISMLRNGFLQQRKPE